MKYALLDGELHIHQRDTDAWWPLSLAEAQHVVDVMNAVPPEVARQFADNAMLQSVPSGMIERAEALLDSDNKPE